MCFFCFTLLLLVASLSYAGDRQVKIDTPHPYGVYVECDNRFWEATEGEKKFTLFKEEGLRCEVAIHNLVKRNQPFFLSFKFKVDSKYEEELYWHSFFQLHSFPDESEVWRCPIMALESKQGQLRMFNRWDYESITVPGKYGCADRSTMKSRTLFTHIDYYVDQWNTFKMSGTLGLDKSFCLLVSVNEFRKQVCGPNTFNDVREPYLKFGIYKPTHWNYHDFISVHIKDISFH